MTSLIKRHILTATIAVSSAALLYAGMTFAGQQQVRDDRVPQVAATATPSFDDNGGLHETDAPEHQPEASDDNGNDIVAETPEPTESVDDHGSNGTDDGSNATASPDDNGGSSGSDGSSGSGGSDDTSKPAATPAPAASPDDHGGHGSDG